MTIAEVISALMKHMENDYLLLIKTIDQIEIENNKIYLYFVDGNTQNIAINQNGERVQWGK